MTFQTPVAAALAPVAPLTSPDSAAAILSVAEALQPDLAQGFQIDALRLRLEMEHAFGGSDATGAWDWKLAYEACEVALVLFLRKFGRALLARAGSPTALLPILAKVSNLLPTHTRRSEEMERFQQFSTPLPMGFAAVTAAQISARDLVLEPSAGTGLLAILATIAGGSLALNELAETRADLLRLLFPESPVTCFDAAQIDDYLDAHLRPSVILMNPPFSALANVDGRTTTATARHIRSALARLAPGGRLVAITGASFAPDVPAWVETFASLTESARLVFTGAVSGAAFAKQGTSFETRISVFDKCRGGEAGGITADLARPISSDVASLLSLITAHVPPRLTLETPVLHAQTPLSPFPGNSAHATRTANGRSHVTSATATTSTADSRHTIASYAHAFTLLLRFVAGRLRRSPSELAIEDLDIQIIRAFLEHIEEGRANSVRSRNARLAAIKSFFRFVEHRHPACLEQAMMIRALPIKRTDTKLIDYLTREEIRALLGAPNRHTSGGLRDRAMLHLAYAAGLRASELLAVRMDDFPAGSFSNVRIFGKGRRERVLPLWKETQAAIRAWLAVRPGNVGPELFLNRDGRRMSRDGFAYRLRQHVATGERSAPSIAAKHVTPHVLRHSCAMHTLQATGDVRKVALWLGHASMQTTEMYLRADPTEKLALLDAHHAPMIKPGRFRGPSDKLMQILAAATQRS